MIGPVCTWSFQCDNHLDNSLQVVHYPTLYKISTIAWCTWRIILCRIINGYLCFPSHWRQMSVIFNSHCLLAIRYNVGHISTHWILKNSTNNLITELYWYFMNTQTVNSWYNFLYIRYGLLFIEIRLKGTNQFQYYKASSLYQSIMDRF